MTKEQANSIPMSEILAKIGHCPIQSNDKDAWYLSPLRNERTASFHVTHNINKWHDFGSGNGGDVISFVQAWLRHNGEDYTFHDALRWLSVMSFEDVIAPTPSEPKQYKSGWRIAIAYQLKDKGLISYIASRGIDLSYAERHVVEVRAYSEKTRRSIVALGFKNESDGMELRNKYVKSCVSPKNITFIRGTANNRKVIHFFEGFFDYLTFLHLLGGEHEGDVIVLNSTSLLKQAWSFIKGFGYKRGYTWLDNNEAGDEATASLQALLVSDGIKHTDKRDRFKGYEDLNAWHVEKLKIK